MFFVLILKTTEKNKGLKRAFTSFTDTQHIHLQYFCVNLEAFTIGSQVSHVSCNAFQGKAMERH